MSRIRTLKPTIWSDSDFVECSANARLLFIAALNFASDFGVMADKPSELKMQCFPNDNFAVAPLIDELVERDLWQRHVAPDGARVLVIRTFCDNQKVDRPNLGRWGDPKTWAKFDERSSNAPRTIVDHSPPEGKGRDNRNGRDDNDRAPAVDNLPGPNPSSSFDQVQWVAHQLARHQLAAKSDTVTNPSAWVATVRKGIVDERRDEIVGRLSVLADPDAVALAMANPIAVKAATPVDTGHPESCRCDGTNWVLVDPTNEARDSPSMPCPEIHGLATVHQIGGAT